MDTREKILEILEKLDSSKRLNSQFEKVKQDKKVLETSVADILLALDKKNSEIEKFEKLTLTGIVSSVMGTKSKNLEKKRDEYLELSNRYERLKKELATTNFEYEILNGKTENILKLKKELKVLLEKREKELMNEDSEQGQTLKQVVYEILNEFEVKEQIENAINITENLQNKLTLLSAALRDAEASSSWRRGRSKHNSIQLERALVKSREYNLDCRLIINKLENSLRHLGYSTLDINIELLDFKDFSGNILEYLFSDFFIKKRVADNIINVEHIYKKVRNIKNVLNQKLVETDEKIVKLENVKKKIILS